MVAPSRIAGFGFIKLCLDATTRLLNTFTAPRQLALPRKKVALIIGINYDANKTWKLIGPQTDIESVRGLLIDTFNFSKEDIVVLSDAIGTDVEFLPTHRNIMREVDKFVDRTESNVDYFFVYAGHSYQRKEVVEPGQRPIERDGQEEYIIPSDALTDKKAFDDAVNHERIISDKKLNECLVRRLGKGSQLVALFDSCHSGTLLNLRHIRCNRVGDLMSLIQDSARRVLVEPLHARFRKRVVPVAGDAPRTLRKSGTQLSTLSRDSTMGRGWSRECMGFCPRTLSAGKSQVVCFSACKDSQATIESDRGGTMIKEIVELLKDNQRPTYRQVMFAAKKGTVKLKEGMKKEFNSHMQKKPCHKFIPLHKFCLTKEEKDFLKMSRSRSDPQLSTLRPLNTRCLLRICDSASGTTHRSQPLTNLTRR